MGKKNGTPKSRWNKLKGCGCYICIGHDYEEWLKLKYRWHKQVITEAINDL